MPGGNPIRGHYGEFDAGQPGESVGVPAGQLGPSRQEARQLGQLAQSERRLEVRQAVVEAEILHLLIPGRATLIDQPLSVLLDAVGSEPARRQGYLVDIGDEGASFSGRDGLHGMER